VGPRAVLDAVVRRKIPSLCDYFKLKIQSCKRIKTLNEIIKLHVMFLIILDNYICNLNCM
jgi:hypothetical protein